MLFPWFSRGNFYVLPWYQPGTSALFHLIFAPSSHKPYTFFTKKSTLRVPGTAFHTTYLGRTSLYPTASRMYGAHSPRKRHAPVSQDEPRPEKMLKQCFSMIDLSRNGVMFATGEVENALEDKYNIFSSTQGTAQALNSHTRDDNDHKSAPYERGTGYAPELGFKGNNNGNEADTANDARSRVPSLENYGKEYDHPLRHTQSEYRDRMERSLSLSSGKRTPVTMFLEREQAGTFSASQERWHGLFVNKETKGNG